MSPRVSNAPGQEGREGRTHGGRSTRPAKKEEKAEEVIGIGRIRRGKLPKGGRRRRPMQWKEKESY